ncbi:DUF2931 family protein [Chimaeribacter arupi]|uniref:DUF2931 family protein n=1 Tax=Chimaeribacter arupi TaxID=2060066 RepID=UPI0027121BCB|nr:DUF2931 family protein [Chimaeribacter arupi]WKZ90748.1 DUF2931 family protein [Chimaeribacter arupi]
MKKLAGLLSLLLLSSCTGNHAQQHGSIKAPWDEWYFTFTTPKALPAKVTLVKVLDTDGYGYGFRTIDQPQGSSVGIWNERKSRGIPNFNKADAPPQLIQFCWDSIIDKKVYETTLFFAPDTWELMITPYPDVLNPKEKDYRRTMIIGLAPQGVVRVWLEEYGRSDIPLTSTKIKTVSGDELNMCKGVTGSNFSRGDYSETTKKFIKDKKYPYGNW